MDGESRTTGIDSERRPRLLVVSRNYPSRALPRLGLWTQRLVQCVTGGAQVKVVSPVPFVPRLPGRVLGGLARYRNVESSEWDGEVEVFHPRFLAGPGYSLHNVEALPYAAALFPSVRRIRRAFPFDLIHAHFTYPDGLVAGWLGRMYGVPVVITEHAPWIPWMEQYPLVRRQARWAVQMCAAHISVSESVRREVEQVVGNSDKLRVVPNVVDGALFRPTPASERVPGQILFVGVVRYCKGVDLLLEAIAMLRRAHPEARLVLVGEAFYRSYQREAEHLRRLAHSLGVADRVDFVGGKTPAEVAHLAARSAMVVLPSRAESFGAVLIEALASGTPVVATMCGGPEEIVRPDVGHLVPTEDPGALAAAMADILDRPQRFDPLELRKYALSRYDAPVVARQLRNLYAAALSQPQPGRADPARNRSLSKETGQHTPDRTAPARLGDGAMVQRVGLESAESLHTTRGESGR